MKILQSIPKSTFILSLALVLVTGILILQNVPLRSLGSASNPGIALKAPAFAKSAQAAGLQQTDWEFILEEAGITAYAKVDQQLDLQFLPNSFKHIRKQTDNYIMGTMYAPAYAEYPEFDEMGEVQVLVHKNGWIVAYLTQWQTSAELFDWVNYETKRLSETIIESTLKFLATELELSDVNLAFYDFRNPNATDLLLIADRADSNKETDLLTVEIPQDIVIHESMWSGAQFGIHTYFSGSWRSTPGQCLINDELVASLNPGGARWRVWIGEFSQDLYPQGKTHTLTVTAKEMTAYCGIAVIYGESSQ